MKQGARTVAGLGRTFKRCDNNGDKKIDLDEFTQLIREINLDIQIGDIRGLFRVFDPNGDGAIDYEEFIRAVRGEMNPVRKALAVAAFEKLDKDNNGYLEFDDIRDVYNASKCQAVLRGVKTEEQALNDWLQTFETHCNLRSGGQNDSRVTPEEWIEYYNTISCNIDDDQYFKQMMNSSWNLDNTAP